MGISAIARIESYKHYEAGGVHKECVRELSSYSNPNWRPEDTCKNVYFERMVLDKKFEDWIYEYRKSNGISGRYIEHSKNPKQETNVMCQCLFTVPGYIDSLSRDEQIEVLRHCYNFFKKEFPDCPVLEASCHFDENSPHLQIDFLPIVSRIHPKRGNEKIFSTTLLMPGRDYFSKFQDRFYDYMQECLEIDLERKKGSKIKHLAPKEFRAITSEIKALQEEKTDIESAVESVKEEYIFWKQELENLQKSFSVDGRIKESECKKKIELENRHNNIFLHMLFSCMPIIGRYYTHYMTTHIRGYQPTYQPPKAEFHGYKNKANFGRMDWAIQRKLDDVFGTNFAEEDIKRFYSLKRSENIDR